MIDEHVRCYMLGMILECTVCEMQATFGWDPLVYTDAQIRDIYNHRVRDLFRGMMSKARRNGKGVVPEYVRNPQVWDQMWDKWDTDAYRLKCAAASRNRNMGASLNHARGPFSLDDLQAEHVSILE